MTYSPVGGLVSTVNSSTATLAGDAVFTGTSEDVSRFSSISISYNSDVVAATSGLSMEFSPDGTNWDRKLIGSLAAETAQVHRLSVINNFFRVVYTNGSGAQSAFRLQTLYHSANSLPLVNRSGQPQNTIDTALVRQTSEVDLDYARVHIPGARAFFFFGYNGSVGTSYEDIQPAGGDVNWQTSATKVEVLSSHAADTSAGLGVRQVELHGLSATGVDQDEIVTMNGTSAVESSLTYTRVNKLHNENVGTYGGSHQGDITCRVTGGGAVLSTMTGFEGAADSSVQYGSGEAGNGYWSVPLGKVLYITELNINIDATGSGTADVVLYEREGILNTSAPFDPRRVVWNVIQIQGEHRKTFKSHIKIKALTDLFFRAKASTGTAAVEVALDFYLVDQDADGA